MLVSVLQKGLQYNMIETHIQPDGTYKPCGAPFSLLTPHRCVSPPLGGPGSSAFTLASPTLQHQAQHQQPPQLMTPTMSSSAGSLQLQSPPMSSQPSSPLTAAKPPRGGSDASTLSPKASRSKLSISTIVGSEDSTAMDVEEAPEPASNGHFDLRQRGTRTAQGRESFRAAPGAPPRATASRFAPSGDLLCTLAEGSATVRLSSAASAAANEGADLTPQGTAGAAAAVVAAWRGDGKMLAVGYSDGACRVWDAAGRLVKELRECHAGRLTALKWSPGGSRLCTVGRDTPGNNNSSGNNENEMFSVGIWDATSWACLARHSKAAVTDVAWQNEAAVAFAAAQTLYCCAADAPAAPPRALTSLHTKRVNAIAWDTLPTQQQSQSQSQSQTQPSQTTSSPTLLASASADSTVRITALDSITSSSSSSSTSTSSSKVLQHSGEVLDVRWLPRRNSGSRQVVTLTREGVALWEVGKEERVREWKCGEAREMCVANGGRFVAVAMAGSVGVWDTESGEVLRKFEGEESCHDLSWSGEDDLLLVTCGGKSCILDLKK